MSVNLAGPERGAGRSEEPAEPAELEPSEPSEAEGTGAVGEDTEEEDFAPESTRSGPPPPPTPAFILYLDGVAYQEAVRQLVVWTHNVLLPVYGREITSNSPWCPRWWEHAEAVAQLHGLWLAWGELTGNAGGSLGPAQWHRDYLGPVVNSLRDPSGPFAGCKAGGHRAKLPPHVDDPFVPPRSSSPHATVGGG